MARRKRRLLDPKPAGGPRPHWDSHRESTTGPVIKFRRTALRVRIEHLWLSLPIAIVVWFGFLRRVGLVDFWWHLKAGEIIVTSGSIPRVDLFSFTCAGRPFVLQSWLVEVLYYALYHVGGLALLITLNTALLVAALLPVYHLSYQVAGGVRMAVLSVLPAVGCLLTFGSIRSQVFSFVCFSVTYWVLSSYRLRKTNALWAIPVLMVAWVNLHGAFVLGLALVGLVLGSETMRRLVLGPRADTLSGRELRALAYILVAAMLATLVNPEGYGVYSAVVTVTRDPVSQSFVTEWQPPRMDQLGILSFYGPFFVTVLVLLYSAARPDWTETVLCLGFAALGLTSLRNAIWFSIVMTPILARYLPMIDVKTTLGPLRRFGAVDALARWMERHTENNSRAPVRHGLNGAIASGVLLITILLSPAIRPHIVGDRRGIFLDRATPLGALDYMESHGVRQRVFTPEIYGDYLVWRLWPEQRSFVDSRVHLFQQCPWVVNDYNVVHLDSHWEDRLARYEIGYILLNKEEGESRGILDSARGSPRWRLIYEDERSVLFEKMSDAPTIPRAAGPRCLVAS